MSDFIMGIDPTKVRTSSEGPEFRVGTRGSVTGLTGAPKEYMYVSCAAAVTGAGYVVLVVDSTGAAAMATDTLSAPGAGQGKRVAVGVAAIAAGGYGWVQTRGACSVRVAANCAAYTQLTSSATAGVVDDATTAGLEVIHGLVATAAAGGAEATVAGYIQDALVGRTL